MSKTPETQARYLADVQNLKNRWIRSLDGGPKTVSSFRGFLQSQADNWTPATWRLRRSALKWVAENSLRQAIRKNDKRLTAAYEAEIAMLDYIVPGLTRRESTSTSAKKIKRLPLKQFIEVQKLLEESHSKYSEVASLLLVCGEVVGARPSEWLGATLIEDASGLLGLQLKNGKATNGRGCGATRVIWMPADIDEKTLDTLRSLIRMLPQLVNEYGWDTVYEGARKVLRRVQITAGYKKYISFYSSRHQFSANLKAGGYSLTQIAALMGQLSITTATANYARRGVGRGGIEVTANKGNMDLVEKHTRYKNINEQDVRRPSNQKESNSGKK